MGIKDLVNRSSPYAKGYKRIVHRLATKKKIIRLLWLNRGFCMPLILNKKEDLERLDFGSFSKERYSSDLGSAL